MRLFLSFLLKESIISIDYHTLFQSFIKKSLYVNGREYFNDLYSTNTAKDFCFSVMLGNKPVFKEDRILLEDKKISLVFSTYDQVLFLRLYNCFIKQKSKEFPLAFSNKYAGEED